MRDESYNPSTTMEVVYSDYYLQYSIMNIQYGEVYFGGYLQCPAIYMLTDVIPSNQLKFDCRRLVKLSKVSEFIWEYFATNVKPWLVRFQWYN